MALGEHECASRWAIPSSDSVVFVVILKRAMVARIGSFVYRKVTQERVQIEIETRRLKLGDREPTPPAFPSRRDAAGFGKMGRRLKPTLLDCGFAFGGIGFSLALLRLLSAISVREPRSEDCDVTNSAQAGVPVPLKSKEPAGCLRTSGQAGATREQDYGERTPPAFSPRRTRRSWRIGAQALRFSG